MPLFKAFRGNVDEAVLTVTIDDPPLNLIGPDFAEDLILLIRDAEERPSYRVVVFESEIGEFFSAHADFSRGPQLLDVIQRFLPGGSLGMLFRRLSTIPIVTIAQVAGRVRGAGSEFVLACDMCFASRERAIFGQTESGLGLLPGSGGIQHLTRSMGRQRAMEVILSGDDYGAERAAQYGWINQALPDAVLDGYVKRLARRIARFPEASLQTIKARIHDAVLPSEQSIIADGAKFLELLDGREAKERQALLASMTEANPVEVEMSLGRIVGEL